MEIFDVDAIVIGAGAIGLSIAAELANYYDSVIVLESEPGFGYHTSSRNSEVIHSGIYYQPGSLKSRLCLEGKALLYEYLSKYDIPYSQCGKLILAAVEQLAALESLADAARLLGIPYEKLDSQQVRQKEPLARAAAAIFLPETGIFDSHRYMKTLVSQLQERGGVVAYNQSISAIKSTDSGWTISTQEFTLKSPIVVNSAGLKADQVARAAGFNYQLFYYKGEYYKCNKIRNLKHLIYSVPPNNGLSLGIHTRNYLDGSIGFGPNAYPVSSIDYSINEERKAEFISDITKYLNIDLEPTDIWPDYAGIRPKVGGGTTKNDFIIRREAAPGKWINLIGMESPGLTCSIAIAKYVNSLLAV